MLFFRNAFVQPIKILDDESDLADDPGQVATASGWGALEDGSYPDTLRYVQVKKYQLLLNLTIKYITRLQFNLWFRFLTNPLKDYCKTKKSRRIYCQHFFPYTFAFCYLHFINDKCFISFHL